MQIKHVVSCYRLITANNATKNKGAYFVPYYSLPNWDLTHDVIPALNSDLEVTEMPHPVLTIHVFLQFCLQQVQWHS